MPIILRRYLIQKYRIGWIFRITRKQFVLHNKKYHTGWIFRITRKQFVLHNKKYHTGWIFRITRKQFVLHNKKYHTGWIFRITRKQLRHDVRSKVYILYFLEKTSRLLFISALPQCGDYSRAATIRSTDVAATIYFSATAMWRLFEGGYYSKYRRRGYYYFSATAMWRLFEGGYYSKYRRRGYYLFQRYRNVATIRGRLLFEVQTSRLLFISALPQCGDYSRAATIRSTDVAATIYFSATTMWRLFEGGYYSKYRRRGYYSKYRRRSYYLFQRYRNVATIRGRLLFEVQTSRLLFISALPQCSDYSRAATIRSTDIAATIYFSSTEMWRLFEGGYYSRCGVYSRKYGIYIYIVKIWAIEQARDLLCSQLDHSFYIHVG